MKSSHFFIMRRKAYTRTPDPFTAAVRKVAESLHAISPQTRHAIGVVILWVGGILFLLSIFDLGGGFGAWISVQLGVLFGEAKIFFPLLVLSLAFAYTRDSTMRFQAARLIGSALFLLAFFGFWHLQFGPDIALDAARAARGGGFAGFLLADPLQRTVGFWGSLVVLAGIALSSLLIVFNTSIYAFLDWVRRILGSVYSVFAEFFGKLFERRPAVRSVSSQEEDESEDEDETTAPGFQRRVREEAAVDEHAVSEQGNSLHDTPDPAMAPATPAAMEVLQPPRQRQKVRLSTNLLNSKSSQPTSGDIKTNKIIIQKAFENFNIPVEMGDVNVGPTVTQYTIKPADGIKVASITGLHNDLALALAAHPIRIEAPIPGKSLVGIEVPNQKVALVTLRELLESDTFKKRKSNLCVTLGKDVSGAVRLADIAAMPHLLIAGSTGSGKTVCVNTLIMSLLFQNTPEELRLILVDPKRVELTCYNEIPHLLTPVITDVKKTINSLKWAEGEMERRFTVLSGALKRDIASYNASRQEKMPYIIIIIDELADVMMTAGQEVETLIIRLAQKARAVGIHLILATQRPSTDVITGLIKANITARIAFAVASQIDSRTILDTGGAERLVGRGDMLFLSAELSKPVRIQGAYVSDGEIDRVTGALKESGAPEYQEGITEKQSGSGSAGGFADDDDDELLSDARDVILQAQKASASLLQRRLRIGYARAARLLDLLEAQGFIGPGDGARPRELLVRSPEEMDMLPSDGFESEDDERTT